MRCPLERIVVVVGHGAERVTKTLQEQVTTDVPVVFVEQHVQRGTGDAASVALTAFPDDPDDEGDVIVMPGDAPLVRPELLARLATVHRESDAAVTLLTAELAPWTWSFGRIVRDSQGRVDRIVERTDATAEELELPEVNTSIYCFRRSLLAPALRRLSPENAQGEYYLTDAVAVLREAGHPVVAVAADDPAAAASRERPRPARDRRGRAARAHQRALDDRRRHDGRPGRTSTSTRWSSSRPTSACCPARSSKAAPSIGAGAVIGPDTRLVDTVVARARGGAAHVARDSVIGEDATVGPYVSLRAGTHLAADAHVGTFVETKNAEIGEGAKVPHLSYMGDVEIGPRANVGAGTITANYDGRNKHPSKIGADARIGSNSVLVAPVRSATVRTREPVRW